MGGFIVGWFGERALNGKAHGIATKIATPIVGITVGYVTQDAGLGIAAAAGTALGLIVDPDMDCNSTLERMNSSRWRMMRLWRPLGYLWFAMWYMYGVAFSHRGISHMPVVGTLTRVMYLLCFPGMALILLHTLGYNFDAAAADIYRIVTTYNDHFLVAVVGLMLSDFAHWAMDRV